MTSIAEIPDFEIAPGFRGFAALAPGGGSTGLLILPEMFGVTPAMQDAARDFAAAGIATLVPNMFHRFANGNVLSYEGRDREIAQERADTIDPDGVCEDIELAIAALRAQVPSLTRIAALGHCIGGGLAVGALAKTGLVAAVSYYGFGISAMGEALTRLAKPAQLHYGLDDPHIPVSEVEAVKALSRSNPNVAVFEYRAGHSFCNPYRPMFDKSQAAMAHERALALIRGT